MDVLHYATVIYLFCACEYVRLACVVRFICVEYATGHSFRCLIKRVLDYHLDITIFTECMILSVDGSAILFDMAAKTYVE